jgi:hypothetical protein
VSLLDPNEENMPTYGRLCIFESAETTEKLLEKQSIPGTITEIMQ